MNSLLLKRRITSLLQGVPFLRWILSFLARKTSPYQLVGAVGAIFNEKGQVLIVEHVFRTDFPWGLPGGWIKIGEDPADTVRREVAEELALEIEVRDLLISSQVGLVSKSTHPPHLGLAFYCRHISGDCRIGSEILSVEWVHPHEIKHELSTFQYKAIQLGKMAFERDHLFTNGLLKHG